MRRGVLLYYLFRDGVGLDLPAFQPWSTAFFVPFQSQSAQTWAENRISQSR